MHACACEKPGSATKLTLRSLRWGPEVWKFVAGLILAQLANSPTRRQIPMARMVLAAVLLPTLALGDNCCYEARGTHEVLEDNTTDCCRLVAPAGETPLSMALKCTLLPLYTCFENPHNKIATVGATSDPGSCCVACGKMKGCASWTHSGKGEPGVFSCNLYSNVGPTKAGNHDGCSAGTMPGGVPSPGPPPQPRDTAPHRGLGR